MKKMIFAAAVLSLSAAFAEGGKSDTNNLPVLRSPRGFKIAREMDPAKLERMIYKRQGGQLKVPNVQKGAVTIVNCQNLVSTSNLEANAAIFADLLKIDVKVTTGTFAWPNPNVVGEASLFVVADDSLPPIVSAPESRWSLVNLVPLRRGRGEKDAFFAARVQKELTRGFFLLAGSQDSNYPNSLMGCITKPEDLDNFADCGLAVDVMRRCEPYLKGYGIVPYRMTSYRKACQEGWAPNPTDDVQKVLWDKVRALPTNPIKIKYDPKRDK